MTGRTHDLAAITALGVVVWLEPSKTITLGTALIAILANQIGGILPDIDQPTAPLWKNLPVGKYVGRSVDTLLGGHRFISHSIIGLAIFGALAYLILNFFHPVMPHVNSSLIWWAFMVGLVSHLFLDSFTKEGVPWLLPIHKKFGFLAKSFRITTGKSFETLIIFPAILLFDIWFCFSHYNYILMLIHQRIV